MRLATFVLAGAALTAPAPPVPLDDLQEIYRGELAELYDPAAGERLGQAHRLMEQYFAAESDPGRHSALAELGALELDVTLLARLAPIRLHWEDLAPGVYYINEKYNDRDVHYFLGVPDDYDRSVPWPLVIKLPAAHAFLTDPPPGPGDVICIYTAWIDDELGRHPDAAVLMPLLKLDELYGPSQPGMDSVIQPMHHAFERIRIDPQRVYMVGHGMSAHAVWNLALHYPTYFAAINPLAGSAGQEWQRLRLRNLRNLWPVVWHDANDTIIRVNASRSIVRAMRQLNLDVHYDETRNVGHTPSADMAEQLYEMMRNRRRELHPRRVSLQSNRPERLFNRIDWIEVREPHQPGAAERVTFQHGSGEMLLYEHVWRLDAEITGPNRIEADASNVRTARFYFNDDMIDFNRPVTIIVNGRTRFEGLVQADLELMLADQRFLGRGWRTFTAAVDVELLPAPPEPQPQR